MNTKKLIMAVVTATTLLVGGLGVALWPSPAEALGAVRKFSGPLIISGFGGTVQASVHNPHPTATYKSRVIVRSQDGIVFRDQELAVGPQRVMQGLNTFCPQVCTVEMTMSNAILQPSAVVNNVGAVQYLYSGDFSR